MIKILIADDSATETALLKHILEEEKDMQVIACAKDGKEAVELAAKLKPDLITMDIQMPIMNGFEATQVIMMQDPVPIVVISSSINNMDNKELNTTFRALEAGALSVLEKPMNITEPSFQLTRKHMINVIRNMAGIKVITRRFAAAKKTDLPSNKSFQNVRYELLAIGASVGGPQALKTILSKLPANFPLPIVIVQHITVGFLAGFCKWMNENSALSVKAAEEGEILQAGHVYFAPEDIHLQIQRRGENLYVHLQKSPAVAGFCPSITVLFQSIAKVCGKNTIAMLLTGMGSDGSEGLLALKQEKAHTIVQDEKSSVVFGMGRVAVSLGAVDHMIDLDEMVHYLLRLCER